MIEEISYRPVAISYRERILASHQAGIADDPNVRNSVLNNLRIKSATGHLIRAARGDLSAAEFKYVTNFLSVQAVKDYEKIADSLALGQDYSLESAVDELRKALSVSGAITLPNGERDQHLHEPNAFSKFIGLVQTASATIRHFMQRQPLKDWRTEQIHGIRASSNVILKLCQELDAELDARGL